MSTGTEVGIAIDGAKKLAGKSVRLVAVVSVTVRVMLYGILCCSGPCGVYAMHGTVRCAVGRVQVSEKICVMSCRVFSLIRAPRVRCDHQEVLVPRWRARAQCGSFVLVWLGALLACSFGRG